MDSRDLKSTLQFVLSPLTSKYEVYLFSHPPLFYTAITHPQRTGLSVVVSRRMRIVFVLLTIRFVICTGFYGYLMSSKFPILLPSVPGMVTNTVSFFVYFSQTSIQSKIPYTGRAFSDAA